MVQFLGQEVALEKGMTTLSSILTCTIPCTEDPGGLQSMGSQTVGQDWATNTLLSVSWHMDTHISLSMWGIMVFAPIFFCSVTQSCLTLCNPMDCSTLGFPVHHQLPELAQTHVHQVGMPSNHLILCCPLLLLPSIFPSNRVFSQRWPKYWSYSFSISPIYLCFDFKIAL